MLLKLKGKVKTKVVMLPDEDDPDHLPIPIIKDSKAECKKSIFKLVVYGKETKFKVKHADNSNFKLDIEFPDAFDLDWQAGCSEQDMTLTVVGDEILVPLVPLVGATVAEYLQPEKIACDGSSSIGGCNGLCNI